MADLPLAGAIGACQVILQALQGWKSRARDLGKYRSVILSILTVLETSRNDGFDVGEAPIVSIKDTLNGLHEAISNALNMRIFRYTFHAEDLKLRLKEELTIVQLQVSSYQAQMIQNQHDQLNRIDGRVERIEAAVRRMEEIMTQIRRRTRPEEPMEENRIVIARLPNQLVVPMAEDNPIVLLPHLVREEWSEMTVDEWNSLNDCFDDILRPPEARPVWVYACVVMVVLVVLGGIAIGLVFGLDRTSSSTTSPTASPTTAPSIDSSETLSAVINNGFLTCGVTVKQGYAYLTDEGYLDGFEVDLCRAVAAAIFGKDMFQAGRRTEEPVQFVLVEAGDRFKALDNRTIDILLGSTSQTMERTVYEVSRCCWICVGFTTR